MSEEQRVPAVAAIEHQREKFREKFGREPGPKDPLFFDPDADEPRPLTDEQVAKGFEDMIAAVSKAGLDPAFMLAWQELGYIIGTENRQLFSDEEVQAFEAAVLRHQGGNPAGTVPEQDDDAGGLDGLVSSLADSFEGVIQVTLREPGMEPVLNLAARLKNSITDDEAGQLIGAAVLAVLTGWLSGAREQGIDADPAIDWVLAHLGVREAAKITPVSGLIGYGKAPKITMEAAVDQLGPALIPSLLWLACGVAATAGGGDARWLRQFDLSGLSAG